MQERWQETVEQGSGTVVSTVQAHSAGTTGTPARPERDVRVGSFCCIGAPAFPIPSEFR